MYLCIFFTHIRLKETTHHACFKMFRLKISFRVCFYFEIDLSGAADECRPAVRELDVPLVLMAAGLAEGRTEEGERGGVEPERRRAEALAVPSTDTATDKP